MAEEIQITLCGNVTADPELRTAGDVSVANFTVACTPRVFDRERNAWGPGETTFMRCTAWRGQAERAAECIRKGDRVIVQGALSQDVYENADGEKRTVYEVSVNEVGLSLRFNPVEVVEKVEKPAKPASRSRR